MIKMNLISGVLCGIIVINTLLLGSCTEQKGRDNQRSPEKYRVEIVSRADITVFTQFPVQIQSEHNVEIYPRANGYIRKIFVKEGDNIAKGSPILQIDTAEYYQTVSATKAALDNAQLEVTKLKPLVEKDIISPLQLKTA